MVPVANANTVTITVSPSGPYEAGDDVTFTVTFTSSESSTISAYVRPTMTPDQGNLTPASASGIVGTGRTYISTFTWTVPNEPSFQYTFEANVQNFAGTETYISGSQSSRWPAYRAGSTDL